MNLDEILMTYYIVIKNKRGEIKFNLGPVKATDEQDALMIGRKVCDAESYPVQYKNVLSAIKS